MKLLASILRNGAFYVAFYGGSAVLVVVAVVSILISRQALRSSVRMWSNWHRWCVNKLLGINVRIEGTLTGEPALYAIKHESFFEAIDTPTLFVNPSVFAKRELFSIPGWGRSALNYGLIPVEREQGAKALRQMLKLAKARVAEQRPLVIFPEGTRVQVGQSPPLRSGFAGMYKLMGLPVIPIAVSSGHVYHHVLKRPGTIIYRVGEAIPPGLPRNSVEQRVHAAMNAFNEPGTLPEPLDGSSLE
jgi:1-acyl-sn-glycerol-3-phosphate acyltransferase